MPEDRAHRPCRVRHYVIATPDMESVCGPLYEFLELEPTPRHDGPGPTEALGFTTTMMRIGTTLIEVVQPIVADHLLTRWFERRGGRDGGFMAVMQTYDADALRERATAAGLKLAMDMDFRGQRLMQFSYKDFGTRFEFYEYTPEDDWWGSPLTGPYSDSPVAEDVVGAEVAVADPRNTAALASRVFLADLDGSAITCIDDRRIDFVEPSETELPGLSSIRLKARHADRVGEVVRIAHVDFELA